jgi:hypothetical protein
LFRAESRIEPEMARPPGHRDAHGGGGRLVGLEHLDDAAQKGLARPGNLERQAPGGLPQAPIVVRPMKDVTLIGADRFINAIPIKKPVIKDGHPGL